ncbi:MAG: hypothetical protein JWN08_642 [Frankiales bacterium]|nr:hypothetical protein [Frankiales bacterium]
MGTGVIGTSAVVDVLLVVVGLALGTVVLLGLWLARARAPVRPCLPADDQPPAGLGRLVPVGRQVDADVRAGLHALDLWLRTARVRP